MLANCLLYLTACTVTARPQSAAKLPQAKYESSHSRVDFSIKASRGEGIMELIGKAKPGRKGRCGMLGPVVTGDRRH